MNQGSPLQRVEGAWREENYHDGSERKSRRNRHKCRGGSGGSGLPRGLGRLPGGGGPVLEEGSLEEVARGSSMCTLGAPETPCSSVIWGSVQCGGRWPDAKASSPAGNPALQPPAVAVVRSPDLPGPQLPPRGRGHSGAI